MGLPVITIVDPSDQSNFTVRTVAFDVTYQDDLDAFTALSLVLEADTVTTFDSGELKKITYVDVVSKYCKVFNDLGARAMVLDSDCGE